MNKTLLFGLMALTLGACDQVPLVSNLTDRPWLRDGLSDGRGTPGRTSASGGQPVQASVASDAAPDARVADPAIRPTAAAGRLGTTVASLGDATQPGFWIETPLVASPQRGKVRSPKTGREVKVELRPRGGAASGGSSLSLGAMRLLDLPLTALSEVEVFAQ